jgi:hypothetical protein
MSQQGTRLVGVYDSEVVARAAARAAERAGADPADIRIDEDLDRVVSLEGEMREEMDKTIAGPGNVGPFTKEMTKGMSIGIIVGGAIGILLSLPFAAIDFGMGVWARFVVVAAIGLFVGATAGWIIGGAFAARRPEDALAAERGVTLSAPDLPAVEEALSRTRPIRLDVVSADGNPVRNVTTRPPEHIMRKIGRNAAEEGRRG